MLLSAALLPEEAGRTPTTLLPGEPPFGTELTTQKYSTRRVLSFPRSFSLVILLRVSALALELMEALLEVRILAIVGEAPL